MDILKKINEWFRSNCNGDWEHGYGITMETLDNPGWMVKIYLYDTELEDKLFETIVIKNNNNDWLECKVENYFFIGMGDVDKLETILQIFYEWQNRYKDDL